MADAKLTSSSTFRSRRDWSEPHNLGINFPVIRYFSSSLQNAYSSDELNGLLYYQNSVFFQLQWPPDQVLCPWTPTPGIGSRSTRSPLFRRNRRRWYKACSLVAHAQWMEVAGLVDDVVQSCLGVVVFIWRWVLPQYWAVRRQTAFSVQSLLHARIIPRHSAHVIYLCIQLLTVAKKKAYLCVPLQGSPMSIKHASYLDV